MGSSKKIFSAVAWSTISNMVNAIYGFIVTPICIRYFGKCDYGLIALATSVNGYMHIADMGLGSTNVRFFATWIASGEEIRVRQLMQTCTAFYGVVGLINAFVLCLLATFAAQIFNVTAEQNVILQHLMYFLALVAIVNWYCSCFGQIINATENVAWGQKCNFLSKSLMVAVLFITFRMGLSLVQFFVLTQIVAMVIIPLNVWKVRKEVPYISFLPKFHWETFKEILPYCFNIFSFSLFQFLFYQSRTVLLGVRANAITITEYQVIGSVAALTSMVSGVFVGALLPSSSRVVAKGDKFNYYRVAYQGTKFITASLAFCGFGLMSVSNDLLMIYVGESFLHLIPWLLLWIFVVIFTSHNQSISSLILAGADVQAISRNSIVASVVGLIATWFLIPMFGAGGPVLGFLIYGMCQIFFYWFYYWPKVMQISSLKVVMISFLPYVLLGGGLAVGVRALPHFSNNWLNVFVFGAVFAVTFGLGALLLFDKEDREFVFSMLRINRFRQ